MCFVVGLVTLLCRKKHTIDVFDRPPAGIIEQVLTCRESMKSKAAVAAKPAKTPAQTRIIRAVASSTALETGQSIKDLESALKSETSKFQNLRLASSA